MVRLKIDFGSEYHNKWPIPDTTKQVHQLVETEQTEGNSTFQLVLCLHLMESTWQVDTNNCIKFVTRGKLAGSTRMLKDILIKLKLTAITSNVNSTTAATTSSMALGGAKVMEAKKVVGADSTRQQGRRARS